MFSITRVLCLVAVLGLINLPYVSAIEMNKAIFDKFGIEVRTWLPDMVGKISKGSEVDLKDTLGMENKVSSSLSTVFIGSILSMQNNWRLGYENYNYTGRKAAGADYDFNSVHYAAGDMVESEVDIKAVKAVLLPTYSKIGDSNFSYIFGVKGFIMNYQLDAPALAAKKTESSFHGIMPLVGARYETGRTGASSYYSEVSGAFVSSERYITNVEIGLHHKLSRKAIISAGYHAVVFNTQKDDDYARFSLGGPFVQLNYKY